MKRVIIVGVLALSGAGLLFMTYFLPIDGCLDHGGFWDYEEDKCECTYSDTGFYLSNPTFKHVAERRRCANLPRFQSDSGTAPLQSTLSRFQCLIQGGIWLGREGGCRCTIQAIGFEMEHPTPGQIREREHCAEIEKKLLSDDSAVD